MTRSEYYAEAVQVIRQVTGAEHVEISDSRTDGSARLTAHTAFDDPTSRPGAPPRRSIELRTLVFWDEAGS